MRTPFYLPFLIMLLLGCSSNQPSDTNDSSSDSATNNSTPKMKNTKTIAPESITKLLYTKDNGTVPPTTYRKHRYDISPNQVQYALSNKEDKVLKTKKTPLSKEQFADICKQLAVHQINVPCTVKKDGPMPTGGYFSSVLMTTADDELTHVYYVGAGKVYGCGDVVGFDQFMRIYQ